MISQKELLDMIAIEAIENSAQPQPHEVSPGGAVPSMGYDLRLVREADGTLRWEDE